MELQGKIQFAEFDAAIADLQQHKYILAEKITVTSLITLLTETLICIAAISPEWIEADLKNRNIHPTHWDAVTSTLTGPCLTLRLLHLYIRTLHDIQKLGRPQIPGRMTTLANGQISANVFPADRFDKILFRGFSADVWFEPGINKADIAKTQALPYQKRGDAKVALILGAGNVSSLTPADVLYKLINERHVVLLKIHPVTQYLGALLEKGLKPLIDAGFLRIVHGGIPESVYLCHHPQIDEIHLTGSDKTFENIVFGNGAIGVENKKNKNPIINKRVTGELGNVSPVIIIPGPWNQSDIRFQAENIAATIMPNNGFNCNASRVLIQHENWMKREVLLQALRQIFRTVEASSAYYPGAHNRLYEIIKHHPHAELFGFFSEQQTPLTFIPYLNPDVDDPCFNTEIFGSFIAETALQANTTVEFINKAVTFCNEKLWGTLNATLLVHPHSLKDPKIKKAFDNALRELRYGTVAINQFAGLSFAIGTTSWGGFPGSSYDNVQSGIGITHNTFMLSAIQKSIFRGPFRVWPKPAWFPTNGKSQAIAKKLLDFSKAPSLSTLIGVVWKSIW